MALDFESIDAAVKTLQPLLASGNVQVTVDETPAGLRVVRFYEEDDEEPFAVLHAMDRRPE